MPSPFPGMDPYLEEPGLWPDVHHGLISETRAFLNQLLRPNYYLRVRQRVYVSDADDPGRSLIVPDVRISDGVATTLLDDEIHDAYLEVIDAASRQVVTVIEILSPTNKLAGSRGRDAYLKKRHEVMHSPSHFVEIDLLRRGETIFTREVLPPYDYLVHLSRVQKRPQAKVWPIRLRQALPAIDIPLRGDDPDAKLDLQAVLAAAYERAAYDLEVDYRKEPDPPLPPEVNTWADELLKAKGLRCSD